MPWLEFREKVIGATDPVKACPGSLRNICLEKGPAEFGLRVPADKQDNCIHASAGPLEAVAEQMTWLGMPLAKLQDPLAQAMVSQLGLHQTEALLSNPQVRLADGREGFAFDLFEGVDSACVLQSLHKC